MTTARTIDVHAHVIPESCLGLVEGKAESANFTGDMTDLDHRLRDMDAMAVDLQVASAWQGFFSKSAPIARQFNDAIAAYAARAPDRLVGLGVVPFEEPECAVEETLRAYRELGLKGVAIGSNVGGIGLDDARFSDFFSMAEEIGCPIFIHPTNPLGADRLKAFELVNLIGFVTDTAVAAARMAMSGMLERHPGLKIHLAHGGGSSAWLAGRWDHGWRKRPASGGAPQAPSTYLKRLYVDSILHDDEALNFAIGFWGVKKIMMGTDYPYDMGMANAVSWIEGLSWLSTEDRDAMLGGSAKAFFGL